MKVYTTDKISLGGHSLDVAWVEGLSSTNVNLGVTAHGWGNHADAGYLTTYTDTDTNTQLSDAQIAAMGYIKTYIDTNTHRGIDDAPVNGATAVSISSNWAFDNVKTAVPAGALFTDTNTTYDLSGYLLNTTDSWSGTHTTSGLLKFTGTGAGQGIQFNSTTVANDAFGIRVNGTSNAGELEFFSTDDDDEAFVWRHYTTGQDGTGTSVEWFRIGAGGNVSANGTVTGSNLSGTNTGDQDLSGYLTTSGKAADSNLLDGLNSTAYMRDDGWNTSPGQDADTQTGMRSDFSYGNNAPNTGELLRFGAGGYSTQFSSQYAGVGKGLNFRTRNGDAASWNPWYGIWHTGNLTNNNQLTNGSNYVSYISTDQIGASLFYDINDTNYFLNPASTSRVNILQTVAVGVNKASSQTAKHGLSLYGGYVGGEPTYGMMFTGTAGSGTHGAVTSDWATYFTMSNSSSRGWIFRRVGSGNSASISAGGAATFDTSVTSNKFYDTNNTNSWLDIRDSSGNYHLRANEGGMYFDAPIFYFRELSNSGQKLTINAGTAEATSSLRAPYFYDLNDTSYYLDPASSSNLFSVTAQHFYGNITGNASTATSLIGLGIIQSTSTGTSYQNNYQIRENSGGGGNTSETYAPQIAFHHSGVVASSIMMEASGRIAIRNNPGTGYENFIASTSYATSSMRAPMFYDSNNTAYYIHADNHSYLHTLALGGNSLGFINKDRDAEIKVSDDNFNGTGAEFVFWGDLVAGNAQLTAEVGNFTSQVRTPVLYDSNNTGYYVNPASTSNLNGLTVNGTITGNISGNANTLDNINSTSFLRSDATDYQNNTIYQRGYLVNETGYRNRGVYGNYSSTKTNHIWSMGTAYKNHASGTNFGNLYGLAYKHTNNSTGGTMAGGHQMVWCSNGTGKSAMGDNIWTSGNVKAPLYYDSNNTGYYINPASTSNLNALNVNTIYSTPIAYAGSQSAYALKIGAHNNTAFDMGIKAKSTSTGGPYMSFCSANTEDVIVVQNSNVGINKANPSYNLDVSGTGYFTSTVTATNFILSSDKRLKNNIKEVSSNHIDVNWKTFEMNSDKGQRRYGVIAQELEEVHPEFVRTDDEGMKSVAYIDLLIAKIAELEARLEKAGI